MGCRSGPRRLGHLLSGTSNAHVVVSHRAGLRGLLVAAALAHRVGGVQVEPPQARSVEEE